jgi:hypothetical protein
MCNISTKIVQKFCPTLFFSAIDKDRKCSFEGLESDVSPARIPIFKDIPADCGAVVNF